MIYSVGVIVTVVLLLLIKNLNWFSAGVIGSVIAGMAGYYLYAQEFLSTPVDLSNIPWYLQFLSGTLSSIATFAGYFNFVLWVVPFLISAMIVNCLIAYLLRRFKL
jgi:hypothetical protein